MQRRAQSVLYQSYRSRYELDPTFRFNGEGIKFYGDGRIITGAHSYIGAFSSIQASPDCTVAIGKGCRISHFVRIYTSNLEADQDLSLNHLDIRKGDVRIGDYVWIGSGVFIREGVQIGDNAVVGANSVVVGDVAPYSIVAGVPARLVKMKGMSRAPEKS